MILAHGVKMSQKSLSESPKRNIIINYIPPFSKGGDLKGKLFIPVYKTGYSSSFFIK
jgi:hypothetical protein